MTLLIAIVTNKIEQLYSWHIIDEMCMGMYMLPSAHEPGHSNLKRKDT